MLNQALQSREGKGGISPQKIDNNAPFFWESPLNVYFLKIFNLK